MKPGTDYQALIAVSAMMVLPLFMRPATLFAATNWPTLEAAGAILQVVGLSLMLVAWLYLGPEFGLLPANRGLVARGPFRLIRHPVYAAWLLTAFGNSMAAPSVRNFALVAVTIPFMVWRIALEEELLGRHANTWPTGSGCAGGLRPACSEAPKPAKSKRQSSLTRFPSSLENVTSTNGELAERFLSVR